MTTKEKMNSDKNIIDKLYWIFWCSTTILTGILAGFMISHAIMFGRFFTWFIESGNADLLRSTYTVFRESSSPQVLYNSFLYLALASGIIWTVLAFLMKRDRIIAIIAGLSTFWVSLVFFGTGFDELEEAVMLGIADETTMQSFASLNVPIHTCFAIFYVVSLLLLLVVALKRIKSSD
jgi:hypothetical protein